MTKVGNKFCDPELVTIDGAESKFFISKIPAYSSQEIMFGALSAIQNQDVSQLPKGTVDKLMSFVSCQIGDGGVEDSIALDNQNAINTYCEDVYVMLQLELKMVQKNYGFLFDGRLQKVLEAMNLSTKSTETSNPSSAT